MNWGCAKAVFSPPPLIAWLRSIPDPRGRQGRRHELSEIFICLIMGVLSGETRLTRIVRWGNRNIDGLRKYLPFPNGIPSVPTMSRVLDAVDEELLSLALASWSAGFSKKKGAHIAIDGKGLRAAARRVRGERTPYILNAVDTKTGLVVGQLPICAKTNEMTAIPELVELIGVEGCTVTIDAIGTTENIMEAIRNGGGDFVLQVKKNCPTLYSDLMEMFRELKDEKERDQEDFLKRHRNHYSEACSQEKNRERYEYRECQCYSEEGGIPGLCEERRHVTSVGWLEQARILEVKDPEGEDVTPDLEEFLQKGSRRQPAPTCGDGMDRDIQRLGIISSRMLTAEEMMEYKRRHWAVENSLHYVLDKTFGEDGSTIRLGKVVMSAMRKFAYNIARLLQLEEPERRKYIPDVLDDVRDNLELGLQKIFNPITSPG